MIPQTRGWNLQRENDNEHANGEHDQKSPPPLLDEALDSGALGLLASMVLDPSLAGLALVERHSGFGDRLLVKTAKRMEVNCAKRVVRRATKRGPVAR